MKLLKVLVSSFVFITSVKAARILGVYPLSWGSHYILGTKLMKGLAEAGHDVTMITPYPTKYIPKNGTWTDVVLDGFDDEFKELMEDKDMLNNAEKVNPLRALKNYVALFTSISNSTFHHPNVKKLIESGKTFDAVIVDQFINDCHNVFGHLFKGHLILASTLGPNPLVNDKVGNPSPISTIPSVFIKNPSKEMNFKERGMNLLFGMINYLMSQYYILPLHSQVISETFPDAPSLDVLYYNVSLVLLNSHPSLVKAVPLVPNMVEVGGYHIDPPKRLPDDLQKFLDSANDGAIYFSLGSTLKSKDMPADKKKIFLDVFRSMKQRVLWKFEDELPEKPENILIQNWMPQQDILAHRNIKLFITHGGLLSSTETIYHGIPVLCIPVFGDQMMNSDKAVEGGFGLKLEYSDENFNEETLRRLIEELLYNPKYSQNARKRSQLYHDRPMTPMQSAVYWVEYVIRHNGAPHLRVAGIGMPWYKYFMVDVLASLLAIVLVILFSVKCLLRLMIRSIISRSKNAKKVKRS